MDELLFSFMISFVLRVRECQNIAAVVFWTEDVDAWSTSAAQPAHFSVSGKYRRVSGAKLGADANPPLTVPVPRPPGATAR